MAENQEERDEVVEEVEVEELEPTANEAEAQNSESADDEEVLQARYDELEDKYLRVNAEMQNMQSRFAKEQATALKYATQKLAKSILPALDNLERAVQVETDSETSQQLKTGVEMVSKTLIKALEDNDIHAVGAVGEQFDPEIHQSVQTAPADEDHPADTIAQVLQKGYVLADRVVRPAMVVIYN
ncbi:hypothetical protein IV73_GL000324 [Weissella kandleri]|uniref:Protein GrpE n=1 Tax=Weissella kandleri TaxID=1616 RepID=A0A0R2JEV3_9LACO|nr:nucleotide exchange factor GrpE [Weissella kandleri]KRN75825.1 hypothetical protein IV73_GL000324 [Weissella kandleri]